ncbi:MAG TPA: M17 family peptidase N-terminal domain-containing protein, partial [Polyangiaceae bacterium]
MPLDIQLRVAPPLDLAADVLVVGILQMGGKTPSLPPSLKSIDSALGGALSKLVAKDEFTGKRDQVLAIATLGRIPADKVVLFGLGEKRTLGVAELRTFAAKAARLGNVEKAKSLALSLPAGLEGELRTVAEGLELGAYRFTKYFTGDRKPKAALATVVIGAGGKLKPNAKALVALGQAVGAAVNLSRDLSNEPPNVMFPEAFAAAAQALAKTHALKIEVFDFKEIRRRGMKLIDAVGRGSRHEPRFVHM